MTPFGHVPQHVKQSQVVGQQAPARPCVLVAVGLITRVSIKQLDRVTVISAGESTCPAGVLPFRLGGQAITRTFQNAGRYRHPLVVCSCVVAEVAPLVLRQALLVAQPVAIGGGCVPARCDPGPILIATVSVEDSRANSELWIGLQEPLELLDRDFLGGDGEPAGDSGALGASLPAIRSVSVGGEPMLNITGPSITA